MDYCKLRLRYNKICFESALLRRNVSEIQEVNFARRGVRGYKGFRYLKSNRIGFEARITEPKKTGTFSHFHLHKSKCCSWRWVIIHVWLKRQWKSNQIYTKCLIAVDQQRGNWHFPLIVDVVNQSRNVLCFLLQFRVEETRLTLKNKELNMVREKLWGCISQKRLVCQLISRVCWQH